MRGGQRGVPAGPAAIHVAVLAHRRLYLQLILLGKALDAAGDVTNGVVEGVLRDRRLWGDRT